MKNLNFVRISLSKFIAKNNERTYDIHGNRLPVKIAI